MLYLYFLRLPRRVEKRCGKQNLIVLFLARSEVTGAFEWQSQKFLFKIVLITPESVIMESI